jgi:hypothetical protein
MEVEECIQKTGNDTLRVMTKETTGLNVAVGVDIVYNKGRGDPTSTMLWSPRKHVGHKRLISEGEESNDEIMAKDAKTSDDDQEVEALGTEDHQHHKDESEWQVEEEYTDLGEEHRIQAGVESDSGRELGGQTSKLGLYAEKKWGLQTQRMASAACCLQKELRSVPEPGNLTVSNQMDRRTPQQTGRYRIQ